MFSKVPSGHRDAVRSFWLVGLFALLGLLVVLSIVVGTRDVGTDDIWAALNGQTETIGQSAIAVRIPRMVLAVLAGGALALAGAVMQGVTRNPLADPGILGVNSGASLAVVLGVAWFGISSPEAYFWSALLGAAVTTLFVYAVGSLGPGGATPLKLTLAGAATSVACVSLFIAVILPLNDIAGGIQTWLIGGVGGATFHRIVPVLPFFAAGLLISLLSAHKLNSLALGDDLAAGLGDNVALSRIIASVGAVLLCAAATALCGPIIFLGLMVPHLLRLMTGVDYRWLLPLSTLGGACFLLFADTLGRVVARPDEIEVSIITALFGAPIFIWIVRRQKVREL
ncbi:ABC transporter permease [Agaricicola taiwanensis]|uniref:ABC transporter permease n=1 Tax=Agaricicola taiwanensis TaxID=591372 RepID=A0A8J3DWH5_9RHOB|nr:iron ABC transporter permease [Agaricicola taiwanensis]GGE49559.1 ABC transporter permease [Agaricicola taiwanensis]